MLNVQKDFNLKSKTTWKIPTIASAYVNISSSEDLKELHETGLVSKYPKHQIVGLGANTLFASDIYEGLVIEIDLKGIWKLSETDSEIFYKVSSGEDWIKLVEKFVQEDLGGIENLAYIPGKVGAAPVQNIAAYGRAFEEVCELVEVYDISSGHLSTLSVVDCEFGYRNSIFKKRILGGDNNFIITSVTLRLTKPGHHKIEKSYYSLSERMTDVMDSKNSQNELKIIYDSIVKIRKSKLPDFTSVGTNGSLFMNPIVRGEKLIEILKKYPNLQYYPIDKMKYIDGNEQIENNSKYKIAAGHIFDALGWKDKRIGNVGTWQKHALILCNFGEASAQEVLNVIGMMQRDFKEATGINIEPEINIIY
ncbi:MAG: UDP-N-acetylmuramate dehydrogenase [Patescibacteria group bacterium]